MAKVQSSLDEIDLHIVPSKGTLGIVTSARTLFDIAQDYLTSDTVRRIFDSELFEAYLAKMSKL
jgi:hypothetical protein